METIKNTEKVKISDLETKVDYWLNVIEEYEK